MGMWTDINKSQAESEKNLIYWKYYKLHLYITTTNYKTNQAGVALLSHLIWIQ